MIKHEKALETLRLKGHRLTPQRLIVLSIISSGDGHMGVDEVYQAAKLAYPDSKVLVFIGDGAFGFYPLEYDTCIRHNLPITTVMGNDATWGIDKTFQLAYYDRAVGTDLRFIRYDKMVEAIGGYAEYVQIPDDVAPAVEAARHPGVHRRAGPRTIGRRASPLFRLRRRRSEPHRPPVPRG